MSPDRRQFLLGCVGAGLALAFNPAAAQELQPSQLVGKIAYVRNGSVWQWSGGNAEEILEGDNISDARWSPDGSALLYVRTGNSFSDLYTYNLANQTEIQITYNQPPYDIGSVEYMQYSSWAIDPDWSQSGLIGFVSDMEASAGALALFLISSVTDVPYLALGPGTAVEEDIFAVQLSADGSLAVYTVRVRLGDGSSSTYVALRDLNTGSAYPIAESKGDQFDPAINPDNAWVAVTIRDQNGITDLWIVNRETGERNRLTRGQNAMAPRWSNDGRYLGWIRMENYQFEIWAAAFSDGKISGNVKLLDDSGVDPMSGLSWWVDAGTNISAD